MDHKQTPVTAETIAEKLEGMRTCLFITRNGDHAVSRPMSTQEAHFNGSIWFMTSKDSDKVAQIKANPEVSLAYAHSNGIRFVFVSGSASLVDDRAKIKELWNEFYKAWFEGPEDPNITLIEVKAARAEYWDNKGGKLGGLADIAIGAVTGETNTLDEHGVVTF